MDYTNFSWRRTNAPELMRRRYDDVWFANDTTGWAVNAEGVVLKTEDGENWFMQKSFPGVYLRCIAFANERLGWIGTTAQKTHDQRLLRTEDGGATWETTANLPAGSPEQICGLAVIDEKTIYACGSNIPEQPTALLKTNDGGATWTALDMKPQAASLVDIYFRDARNGWMTGGKDNVMCNGRAVHKPDLIPVLLRTSDGGMTWTDVTEPIKHVFPRNEWGWKIQEVPPSTILVCLQNYRDGAILRSDDDGITWQRVRVNDRQRNSNLEGIGFLDANRGWVGGWGDLSYTAGYSSSTADGGQNWEPANEVLRNVNRFRMIGSPVRVAYAAGATVYKFADTQGEPARDVADTAEQTTVGHDMATIPLVIPEGTGHLLVDIFEPASGVRVLTLADELNPSPGDRAVTWDLTDSKGDTVPAGIYFVRINFDEVPRTVVIRRD